MIGLNCLNFVLKMPKLLLVVFFSFLCWTLIMCHLFAYKQQAEQQVKYYKVSGQIDDLEIKFKQLIESNQLLLFMLKRLRTQIIKAEKDIKKLINENPAILIPDKGYDNIKDPVICVLLFACDRVTVKRSLDQLLKYRPSVKNFPILVSQDCGHEPTRKVLESYSGLITLISQPDQSDIFLPENTKKFEGYYKISRHYGWALNQTFRVFNYNTVIIVEDDLDISPDFFEYFKALYPILKTDPTLYCISAWNDNGKEGLITNRSDILYRSDFFPGLGWMLTKDLWFEFETKWPKAYWDDWVREPEQRKNRSCIRPELSRTRTFGKIGVSKGLFFEKHLKYIKLNDVYVSFTHLDLTYLLKKNYDKDFIKKVYDSHLVTLQQLQQFEVPTNGSLRLTYLTKEEFKESAKALGLMDDFKAGVPRTGYIGIVSFTYKGKRVYLAPLPDWKGYDKSWK